MLRLLSAAVTTMSARSRVEDEDLLFDEFDGIDARLLLLLVMLVKLILTTYTW